MAILIAGGGIGGLATALALARHEIDVHVIEKASEFGEIGAGIQLAPNASWALDRLDLLAAVHEHAVFPSQIKWMDAVSGRSLTSLDLGDAFRAHYQYRYLVMHRSDLLSALLARCRAHPRIRLETNKDVVRIEDRGNSAAVHCADGSAYTTELLVGADGLWSTIRAFLVDDGDPVCSQYVAYRGAIPTSEISEHAGLDSVMLWTGPDMHLVQYPVRRGKLYNQVAVFKSERYRAGTDDWGTPDEMDAHFGGGAELVRSALTKMKRNRRWPMYDRLPTTTWSRNRVVLLGDAAHPMLQYLAQGAAQALEDSVVFGDAIAAHGIADGITAYERERQPRTARVQTLAREWGEYWHLHDGPARTARDTFLHARAPDDYQESDWFYGYAPTFFKR